MLLSLVSQSRVRANAKSVWTRYTTLSRLSQCTRIVTLGVIPRLGIHWQILHRASRNGYTSYNYAYSYIQSAD